MKSIGIALVLGVGLLVAGCGSSGAGACTTSQSGTMTCVEFSTGYTSQAVMAACSTGTYSAGGCASTNRVGRCAMTTSGLTSTSSFYSPLTTAQAMTACAALNGTFTAN